MPTVLPPPSERFDPITARWLTPGGPLHDPERGDDDPDRGLPATLVGPIPRELAEAQGRSEAQLSSDGPRHPLRWATLIILVMWVLAILAGGTIGG